MKTSYIEVGGLRLRIASHGSGPPLLLITGIGASLDMWKPIEALLPGRELIAFDAPGVGGSQRPRLPRRLSGRAELVRALMDVLALARAAGLGYSFGGALAQELTRRAPERVRRLVLCATGPGLGGVPPKPLAALMLATPARYYHPRLLELCVPLIAGGRTRRVPGTRTSSTPPRAGRACRGCTGSRTRRWSWAATTTPRCRCPTGACSRPACRTGACMSCAAAATCSCSTSPATRRRRSTRSSACDRLTTTSRKFGIERR